MLQGAPAGGEQGEPAFAEAAQRALEGVAGAGTDIEFPAVGGLLDRDVHTDACAVVAGISKGWQAGRGSRYSPGRAFRRAAVMSCTEPGSASDTQSGKPPGVKTAWTLPPWQWALPEYHRSMASPLTLIVFSRHGQPR